MATARSDLKFTVGADMSPFAATMRRVGMTAQSTAAKVGSAFKSSAAAIGGLAVSASKAGVAIAGLAGSASLLKGIKLAADMQSTTVAFKTLTGSAETANKVLGELKQLNAETPFEFPELADAGRKLIAFGEGADTVAQTLRRVGDVSSGIQAPIGEIAELYGKARVQGRLFGEDINQLTGRGIPIIQELAKQFGVAESEVKKLVEQGEVGFPNLEKAFVSMTSQGGIFFGMMEEQSRTFNGRMSTLTDAVNDALSKIGEPIMQMLIPQIESLTKKLETVDFAAIGQDIVKGLPEAVQSITFIAEKAYQFLQIMNRVGEATGVIIATLASPEYWAALGDLIGAALLQPLAKFKQAFDELVSGRSLAGTIKQLFTEEASNSMTRASVELSNRAAEALAPYEDGIAELMRPLKTLGDIGKDIAANYTKPPTPAAGAGAQTPQSDIYDRELAEQRARVAADAYKVPQIDGSTYGPPRPMAEQFGPPKSLRSSRDGRLFGESARQSNRLFGEPGQMLGGANAFSQSRRYGVDENGVPKTGRFAGVAGVAGPGVTGGLGEKRRLRTSADEKEGKKNLTLQEKQVSSLESIESKIGQALTVN